MCCYAFYTNVFLRPTKDSLHPCMQGHLSCLMSNCFNLIKNLKGFIYNANQTKGRKSYFVLWMVENITFGRKSKEMATNQANWSNFPEGSISNRRSRVKDDIPCDLMSTTQLILIDSCWASKCRDL